MASPYSKICINRPRSDGSAESQEASAAAPKLPQPQQQQPQQQRLDARMLINQRRAAASANGATAPAAAARPLNMDQLFPRPRAEAVTRGADRDPPVRGVSPHNIKQLMPRPPSMGRAASEEPSAPGMLPHPVFYAGDSSFKAAFGAAGLKPLPPLLVLRPQMAIQRWLTSGQLITAGAVLHSEDVKTVNDMQKPWLPIIPS